MTILTGRTKVLTATISMIVLASLAGTAEADDRGELGGMVGGIVGGTFKAVGGIMGDLGALAGNNGGTAGIVKDNDNKVLDLNLGAPDGIQSGIGVAAKPGLKAKLKVKVGDTKDTKVVGKQENVTGAKAKVRLSGPAKTKAKVGAKVATKAVGAKVTVSSGGSNGGADDGGDNDRISHEIAGLSSYERLQLKRKCAYVLSSPSSYNRDAVQVCGVIAQLAGL